MSLYDKIGADNIAAVVSEFYQRAFNDVMIGHFFFHHDQAELTAKQVVFTSLMLGAKHLTYSGKTLQEAHRRLPLKEVHFRRRQRILAQVLAESSIPLDLQQQWLDKEEKLKGLVINSSEPCI